MMYRNTHIALQKEPANIDGVICVNNIINLPLEIVNILGIIIIGLLGLVVLVLAG